MSTQSGASRDTMVLTAVPDQAETALDRRGAEYMTPSDPTQASDTARIERFRSLYEANHGPLESYCRRRCRPADVDDALSEIFLTAWRRLDDHDGPTSATDHRLWLFGVARHVLANQRRGAGRRDRLHLRLVDDASVSDEPDPGADTASALVLTALSSLPDADQEILRLVTWEELSLAEAGEVLGCSANAAGIRVHRARQRLADALASNTPTNEQKADPR